MRSSRPRESGSGGRLRGSFAGSTRSDHRDGSRSRRRQSRRRKKKRSTRRWRGGRARKRQMRALAASRAVAVGVYNRVEAKAAAEMAVARVAVKVKATWLFNRNFGAGRAPKTIVSTRTRSASRQTKRRSEARRRGRRATLKSLEPACWLFPSRKADCRGERRENQLVGCSVATS